MPDVSPSQAPTPDADRRDLEAQGYRQELSRTLGSFSAFAAGFSYLSLLTGLFQNFHLGYQAGGPAFFWTWPVMLAGQFAVALCFAELAAHYPLCGGVYQWSRHVSPPTLGWLAGFVYLASLLVTLAAVALALQITLPQVFPASQGVRAGDRGRGRGQHCLGEPGLFAGGGPAARAPPARLAGTRRLGRQDCLRAGALGRTRQRGGGAVVRGHGGQHGLAPAGDLWHGVVCALLCSPSDGGAFGERNPVSYLRQRREAKGEPDR
jgi:amino acid transporter